MSRLAGVHLSELRFEKAGHLKDGCQSCLNQFNPQKVVNLESVKNRIDNIIFSRCTQRLWKSDFLAN